MLLNKILGITLLAMASGIVASAAEASKVCPVQPHQPLRSVDVFDGPPEDLATLIPDQAGARSGYWQLGYVYDADRNITIRCKYAGGPAIDVRLTDRVERCSYVINTQKTLALECR